MTMDDEDIGNNWTYFVIGVAVASLFWVTLYQATHHTQHDVQIEMLERYLNLEGLPHWVTREINENTTIKNVRMAYENNKFQAQALFLMESGKFCNVVRKMENRDISLNETQ